MPDTFTGDTMKRRIMAAFVMGSLATVGPAGCGTGDGLAHQASSECRTKVGTGGAGRCVLDLSLVGATVYDYVVHGPSLPVLSGGVQLDVHVQTEQADVRVSWRDPDGKDVVTVVNPGKPQSLRGLVVAQDQAGEQGFTIHFQLPDASFSAIDAAIVYG
jgi:hypothetical protein